MTSFWNRYSKPEFGLYGKMIRNNSDMLSANPEFHGKRKYEEIENEDTYLLPDSLRRPHTYGILPQVSKVKNHTNP